MAVVVLKVIALIFQRIARLIFHLPPRPATTHELIDVPLTHPHVRHPAEVLDHVLADLPILYEIDPHIRSRGIERYVVHKAKPLHHTRGTVIPLILGHAPGFLSSLHLFEEIRMVACFHPENIVATVLRKRLAALRSPSFLAMPSWCTMGSGINGITARKSGWIIAAPNI